MPRGGFIGLPVDGNDTTIATMRGDIRKAKGQILTVESGDWDNTGAANTTYDLKRFGGMPPDSMVELLSVASREVYAACGLNPSLFIETQGSGAREAYRQALFGTICAARQVGRRRNYPRSSKPRSCLTGQNSGPPTSHHGRERSQGSYPQGWTSPKRRNCPA